MKSKPKVLCITGPMGSGKSTVARFFAETYGIPVYFADTEAKKAYFDISTKSQIIDLLGKKMFPGGDPDFKQIASKVFANPGLLKKLERIIHPFVDEDFKKWLNRQCMPYVIMENALLPASDMRSFCDEILLLKIPKSEQIERIALRDGFSKEHILTRIDRQTHLDYENLNARWELENSQSFINLMERLHSIHRFMVK